MTKYYGSCLCGSVTFMVIGEIEHVIHCHCTMCKKSHGAAFASFGVVDENAISWHGQENIKTYHSSPKTERKFCQTCGANLQWHKYDDPFNLGKVSFTLGLLDTSFVPETEVHYCSVQKAPWVLNE